jgi:hypothetical protein
MDHRFSIRFVNGAIVSFDAKNYVHVETFPTLKAAVSRFNEHRLPVVINFKV